MSKRLMENGCASQDKMQRVLTNDSDKNIEGKEKERKKWLYIARQEDERKIARREKRNIKKKLSCRKDGLEGLSRLGSAEVTHSWKVA